MKQNSATIAKQKRLNICCVIVTSLLVFNDFIFNEPAYTSTPFKSTER